MQGVVGVSGLPDQQHCRQEHTDHHRGIPRG